MWIKTISRYGFNPHHAQLADGIEVFIGQGQKVGMGGHLMGQKVTDQVAEMRSLPSGIDQRSPARHPDWLGPDDLAKSSGPNQSGCLAGDLWSIPDGNDLISATWSVTF